MSNMAAILDQHSEPDIKNEKEYAREVLQDLKRQRIREACKARDLPRLGTLALSSEGFISDDLRGLAWPIVLGVSIGDELDERSTRPEADNATITAVVDLDAEAWDEISWKDLEPHRDESQVKLDTNRSFVDYPSDDGDAALQRRKNELTDLIISVLRRYPHLHYFQGFHDIAQILYLVLPPPLRAPTLARLANLRIRDFMLPYLSAIEPQLDLVTAIVAAADPTLASRIAAAFRRTEATRASYWAMPVTLTMFAHQVASLPDIARLFDALLAREPAFAPYLVAALVLTKRDDLVPSHPDPDDPLSDLDDSDAMAMRLQNLARRTDIDADALVAQASSLAARFPPSTSPKLRAAWRAVPSCSVLKTALDPEVAARQTMKEGEEFWREQNRVMQAAKRWGERKKAVRDLLRSCVGRKPARRLVVVAVAVGVGAYWLQRHPGTANWAFRRVLGFGGGVFGPAGL